MSGAWVTWPAELRTRPGITDITAQLDRAVQALRAHPDIADAAYQYTPRATTVAFRLLVRWGLSEHRTQGYAHAALHDCLPHAGIGIRTLVLTGHTVATVQLDRWPSDLDWSV